MKILPTQIAIVGPDGAGKTTLVQKLEREFEGRNVRIIYTPEVVHKENSSAFFAGIDSVQSLFPFLCKHYYPYIEDAVIFDRNISIDAKVYGDSYSYLGKTAGWLSKFVPVPKEVLFLDVGLETALERNVRKVHGFQHHETRDSLLHIINKYKDVLKKLSQNREINLHIINAGQLNETEVLTQAMNILNPIITEARSARPYLQAYSENSLKESIVTFIHLGKIKENEADHFLERVMQYRSLFLHLSIHSAIGLATPTGIGAPISSIARPLWTLVNMVYDKIKRKQNSIHNTEIALLSTIPILGNAAYLTNLIEDPEMFDFFIYHVAKHVKEGALEEHVLNYTSNEKIRNFASKSINYMRTNYELPFIGTAMYGILTDNTELALASNLTASGILIYTDRKKKDLSVIPRAMRIASLNLLSFIFKANGEYLFSNPNAMLLSTLLGLGSVAFTYQAANQEERVLKCQ